MLKAKQDAFRIIGATLLLLSLLTGWKSFEAAKSGDVDISVQASSRSLSTQQVSNTWSRATLVIAIAGIALIARSMRPKGTISEETSLPPAEEPHSGPRCIRCDAPLPIGANLCPKCGWTQPS